jgi:hypothetical protein
MLIHVYMSLDIQKRKLMMPLKNAEKVGCFSFPKDLFSGTRQSNSNQNTGSVFSWEKRAFLLRIVF